MCTLETRWTPQVSCALKNSGKRSGREYTYLLMARPRKSRIDKQSVRVVLHLTMAEKKRLDAEATRAKLPVATLARLRAVGAR